MSNENAVIKVHIDYPIEELGEIFNLDISEENMVALRKDVHALGDEMWEAADDYLRRVLIDFYGAKYPTCEEEGA